MKWNGKKIALVAVTWMASVALVLALFLQVTGLWAYLGPFDQREAEEMLQQVSVLSTGVEPLSNNPSVGIYLPEDLPGDYFDITVVGFSEVGGQGVDLLSQQEVAPGSWIVVSHLDEYEYVSLRMELRCGKIVATRNETLWDSFATA